MLAIGADAVLLDNMSPDQLRGRAHGGGTRDHRSVRADHLQTAPAMAETGVDLISAGWLTHSAAVLDIGLEYLRSPVSGCLLLLPDR